MSSVPFAVGEVVLLVDKGENRRLITLKAGAKAHGHKGYLEHDRIIGAGEGTVVRASSGATYQVYRPRLSEYVLEMPRRSAIVYPKDVGMIVVWADIYPGATVVESGMGSGSLTLALLRAVGPTGQVIVYERRADMIASALTNIRKLLLPGAPPIAMPAAAPAPVNDADQPPGADTGEAPEAADAGSDELPPVTYDTGLSNLIVRQQNVYDGLQESEIDRLVLDLPEPWHVIENSLDILRPGGMVACYSPSIIQVQRTHEVLDATRAFTQIEVLEVLYRPWHIQGQAVRPVQQMVSHTGFLTFARRTGARGRRSGEPDWDAFWQTHPQRRRPPIVPRLPASASAPHPDTRAA
ncbi:MAG: tRNA (adenine-N1)-methyltransferase [Chloroflexota bacterium]